VIGWARGGRFGTLARASVRALPLLGAGVLLVVCAQLPQAAVPARLLVAAGYLAALGMLWINRDRPWLPLVLIGTALNAAVIVANGGRMPVARDAIERAGRTVGPALLAGADPRHVLAAPGSPLGVLGDRWAFHAGGFGVVLSAGDVLLAVGIAGFVQGAMHDRTSAASNS